jgi:hypothetical protein
MTDAHNQATTNRYVIHYPEHPERTDDPHYKDFNHFRQTTKASAQCSVGLHRNDFSECSLDQPLEVHHTHIEFALQNDIDLAWLEVDYPGISNPDEIGAWVESAANLEWLCIFHHRASGTGKHHAAVADFEGERYIRGLIGKS